MSLRGFGAQLYMAYDLILTSVQLIKVLKNKNHLSFFKIIFSFEDFMHEIWKYSSKRYKE
jgi:hypothetical protein